MIWSAGPEGSDDLGFWLGMNFGLILVNWGEPRIRVLGFGPQGWDLDCKIGFGASMLGFGPQRYVLDPKAEFWA